MTGNRALVEEMEGLSYEQLHGRQAIVNRLSGDRPVVEEQLVEVKRLLAMAGCDYSLMEDPESTQDYVRYQLAVTGSGLNMYCLARALAFHYGD